MTNEIVGKEPDKLPRTRIRELLIKHSLQDPNLPNAKRERFLALLKSRYGYTNDKAIDELERLLKQFYRSNRSLGIRRVGPNDKNPHIE